MPQHKPIAIPDGHTRIYIMSHLKLPECLLVAIVRVSKHAIETACDGLNELNRLGLNHHSVAHDSEMAMKIIIGNQRSQLRVKRIDMEI
jgi:hypothetical protein